MKATKLLHRYVEGDRTFCDIYLRGQSFKGQNLADADFSGAEIRGADFSRANLEHRNFSQCRRLRWLVITLGARGGTHFRHVTLTAADVAQTMPHNSAFCRADLTRNLWPGLFLARVDKTA
jgi:uncharacterized protein YjbI with pentapeptide repeats